MRKFKNDIYFMVDIDFTYIEPVEPRMTYVEPLGYEVNKEQVEGYVEVILQSTRDDESIGSEPIRKLCKQLLKLSLRNLQRRK